MRNSVNKSEITVKINMPYDLSIPITDGDDIQLDIDVGEQVYILGPNGSGKSSLMHHFYKAHSECARRITAHRQTWLSSNAINLSPYQKERTESQIKAQDTQPDARWKDDNSAQRPNIAIYDLIDAENMRAREIANAVDLENMVLARELSEKDSPITTINELLRSSNMPINISIDRNQQVVATRPGGIAYSIAELSDGERNALLIAASVLTAEDGHLILIDEPERHLHRSILSPFLTELFSKRSDCAFVISTHEVMLPLDARSAKVVLVRECDYAKPQAISWTADLLDKTSGIDDDILASILGQRRKLLFVEGGENSLDKPIYSLIFPDTSIVPKGTYKEVELAVRGIRGSKELHWLLAFGVIDNDGRDAKEIQRLQDEGIWVLSVFTVESIYYDKHIMRRLAERHAGVTGEDEDTLIANATNSALRAISAQVQRLGEIKAEKSVRNQIFRNLPTRATVSKGESITIQIEVDVIVAEEVERLTDLIRGQDLAPIIQSYPIRETQALTEMVKCLGFQSRHQYESAVRKLIMDDPAILDYTRGLFHGLSDELGSI